MKGRFENIQRIKNLGIDVELLEDGIECTVYMPNELLAKFAELMELEDKIANS